MKKSKKTLMACLTGLLIIVLSVGGVMADDFIAAQNWAKTTSETIKVALVQQERVYGADGKVIGLAPFTRGEELIPLVGSAQYDGTNFDKYGMPTAEGYVDQIVRVKNTGTAEAYVRVVVAIPKALDNPNDAGHNALHWNLGNRFMADGTFSSGNAVNGGFADISWKHAETANVHGVDCNLYTFTYKNALAAGETTGAAAFVGFYLDKDVNVVDGHILLDGEDTGFTNENVRIYVKAQAVQTVGFDKAETAFFAAGIKVDDGKWPAYVTTGDELQNAINSGASEIILGGDINLGGGGIVIN